MAYVILVNADNSLSAPKKERIIQKSKLFDDFCFLVHPDHNGYDMTGCTVLLEYVKPVSREYKTEILTLSAKGYKEYLKYHLPVDTEITAEAGDLEIQLSFIYVDIDINGKPIQRVRKTAPALKIHIVPISVWSDIVPDEALTAIDQRIIKTDAQIKELQDMSVLLDMMKADDLHYNKDTSELQLMSGNRAIGSKVVVPSKDALNETLKDGVPVIAFSDGNDDDFNTDIPSDDNKEDLDNVVEFGNIEPTETEEKDNIVEF